jgi:hypothetical protein
MPDRIDQGVVSVGMNRSFGTIWWPPEAKLLRIGDRTFERGLGTCAQNAITYRLDGRYRRFQAWVGVDAEVADKPAAGVIFRVYGDGKTLFASGIMRASDAARPIDVSVEGVKELVLEAGHAGDGGAADHADWAEPVLLGIAPRARFGDGKAAFRVKGGALALQLDAKGYPCGVELLGSANYPVDGGSEVEGCAVTNTRVEKTPRGVQVARTLSCGARLAETFEPAGQGVRWQVDIESEENAWGGQVNTVLRWLNAPSAQLWTAWGGGQEWRDPLRAWDFRTGWYEYGTFFNRSYGVSLPVFTIMDRKRDAAVTLEPHDPPAGPSSLSGWILRRAWRLRFHHQHDLILGLAQTRCDVDTR